MAAPVVPGETTRIGTPAVPIRLRAAADTRRLRALAAIALRDGAPHGALRAANARAAAHAVIAHARRMSALVRPLAE